MFVVFVFLFTAVLSLKLCFLLPRFPFWQCLPWSRAGLQFVSSSSAPPPWPAWRTPVSKDISHFPAGSGSSGAELKISYLHRNKSFFRISGSKNSKAHDNFFFFFPKILVAGLLNGNTWNTVLGAFYLLKEFCCWYFMWTWNKWAIKYSFWVFIRIELEVTLPNSF